MEKGITLRSVEIGDKEVPADTPIWIFNRFEGVVEVEYKDRRGRIPSDAVAISPVNAPSIDELRKLDSCFGLPDDAFEREVLNQECYFEILRCRVHGKRFLLDYRGTVGWYSRLTFLGNDDGDDIQVLWARFHYVSDDWLNVATTMIDYYALPQTGEKAWPGRACAVELPFEHFGQWLSCLENIKAAGE
jgi:hypothetical protein